MPRCKKCSNKFIQYQFNNKFCKDLDCQVAKGLYLVDKQRTQKLKEINKDVRQRKKALYPKKHKALLQDQINLLARKIDSKFYTTCIDCERSIVKGSHGAHRNNVGGNENIRFNLHNIHASTDYCNMYNTEHKPDYDKGLKSRYSEEYYNYVRYELNTLYPIIKLSTQEIDEKLTIVRKLNREFNKTVLTDSISARNIFNKIIGIYK
tara:strand:+ start:330 stop:950 length:621 start_codon:yes stop_codon:yes gene_type:complete